MGVVFVAGLWVSVKPYTCHAATFFYDDFTKATKYTIVEGCDIRTFNGFTIKIFTPILQEIHLQKKAKPSVRFL